jgi:3-ketosteroid 9alpha-monooxygenase subunit B
MSEVEEGGKRKSFRTVVADITRETRDAVTLHLFAGAEGRAYVAGQFLTIDPHQFLALAPLIEWMELEKKAKEPPRAYSMSSAPHDPFVSITVKVDGFKAGRDKYPPLLSPYLVDGCRVGQEIEVKGYVGHYVLDTELPADAHIVHLCAGSGIVPNLSMLRDALHRDLPYRHTLIYGNRLWDDVICRKMIDELAERHPEKLNVVHCLSGEPNLARCGSRNVYKGRVDGTVLERHLGDREKVRVYMCGPAVTRWERVRAKAEGVAPAPRFIETMLAELEKIGVGKDRIEKEAFG